MILWRFQIDVHYKCYSEYFFRHVSTANIANGTVLLFYPDFYVLCLESIVFKHFVLK